MAGQASALADKSGGFGQSNRHQVTLILVDRLPESVLQDAELPEIRQWRDRGGIGLLSLNNQSGEWLKELGGYKQDARIGDRLRIIKWETFEQAKAMERIQRANADEMVVFASTEIAPQEAGKELVPLFMAGGNIPAGSVLISDSTRRDGIVTGLDVSATIAHFLGVDRAAGLSGNEIRGMHIEANEWNFIAQMKRDHELTRQQRPFYVAVFAAAVCIGFVAMLIGLAAAKIPVSLLIGWCTAVLSIPGLLLIVPVWNSYAKLWIGLASLLVTVGLLRFRNLWMRFVVLGVLQIVAVGVDAITGGHFLHQSVFSYDPITGARFYGIGNEFMGLLIGWWLVVCGAILSMRPTWRKQARVWVTASGIGMLLLLAAPALGANAGGAITAGAAIAAVWSQLQVKQADRRRIDKHLIIYGCVMSGSIAILALLHRNTAPPTHIGHAIDLLRNGQFEAFGGILQRKLQMSLRILGTTVGAPLFLAVLTGFACYFWAPFRTGRRRMSGQPEFERFVSAGTVSALVAFAVNDSGLVAAAMLLLPLVYVWFMAILVAKFPTPHTTVPTVLSPSDTLGFFDATDQGH
ncbi:hypothetical protein skT53_21700 [Effusibacillus dendaii]|uniref:Uncharacterized protein n=2 Tax=Effusibacillus dendaii TaxID=2743772 RepID=A0A7I8DAQ9_9BACL|nr:hypothetical protein skT53_21700 [Effusibacillus dendaii]